MREILFRGKGVNTGNWIESMTLARGEIKRKKDDLFLEVGGNNWKGIIPETLGQYTGLKDKNGKKIFEGDVVNYFIHNYRVGFHNGSFGLFSFKHVGFTPFFDSVELQCEIVGNIHDNPELLEK